MEIKIRCTFCGNEMDIIEENYDYGDVDLYISPHCDCLEGQDDDTNSTKFENAVIGESVNIERREYE